MSLGFLSLRSAYTGVGGDFFDYYYSLHFFFFCFVGLALITSAGLHGNGDWCFESLFWSLLGFRLMSGVAGVWLL